MILSRCEVASSEIHAYTGWSHCVDCVACVEIDVRVGQGLFPLYIGQGTVDCSTRGLN